MHFEGIFFFNNCRLAVISRCFIPNALFALLFFLSQTTFNPKCNAVQISQYPFYKKNKTKHFAITHNDGCSSMPINYILNLRPVFHWVAPNNIRILQLNVLKVSLVCCWYLFDFITFSFTPSLNRNFAFLHKNHIK